MRLLVEKSRLHSIIFNKSRSKILLPFSFQNGISSTGQQIHTVTARTKDNREFQNKLSLEHNAHNRKLNQKLTALQFTKKMSLHSNDLALALLYHPTSNKSTDKTHPGHHTQRSQHNNNNVYQNHLLILKRRRMLFWSNAIAMKGYLQNALRSDARMTAINIQHRVFLCQII